MQLLRAISRNLGYLGKLFDDLGVPAGPRHQVQTVQPVIDAIGSSRVDGGYSLDYFSGGAGVQNHRIANGTVNEKVPAGKVRILIAGHAMVSAVPAAPRIVQVQVIHPTSVTLVLANGYTNAVDVNGSPEGEAYCLPRIFYVPPLCSVYWHVAVDVGESFWATMYYADVPIGETFPS